MVRPVLRALRAAWGPRRWLLAGVIATQLVAALAAPTFARLKAGLGTRVGLVSSHRFSTVRTADRVAVVHEGRLLEFGTHEELVKTKGRYATLFERQAAAYR